MRVVIFGGESIFFGFFFGFFWGVIVMVSRIFFFFIFYIKDGGSFGFGVNRGRFYRFGEFE